MQRLPESVKKLWRIGGLVTGLIVAIAPTGGLGAWLESGDASLATYALLLVPVALFTGLGYWWAGVRYKNWVWQITDMWVEAKHGVLNHRRVVIPRNRIQTVTTNSGPIDRMLDLESITVHTAGAGAPNLTIPHLTTATASKIRKELGQGVGERAHDATTPA